MVSLLSRALEQLPRSPLWGPQFGGVPVVAPLSARMIFGVNVMPCHLIRGENAWMLLAEPCQNHREWAATTRTQADWNDYRWDWAETLAAVTREYVPVVVAVRVGWRPPKTPPIHVHLIGPYRHQSKIVDLIGPVRATVPVVPSAPFERINVGALVQRSHVDAEMTE